MLRLGIRLYQNDITHLCVIFSNIPKSLFVRRLYLCCWTETVHLQSVVFIFIVLRVIES